MSVFWYSERDAENNGQMGSSQSDILMYGLPYTLSLPVTLHHLIAPPVSSLRLIGRAAQSQTVLPWRCWLGNVPVRWSRWQWNRLKLTRDWSGWWVTIQRWTPESMNAQYRKHSVNRLVRTFIHVFLNSPPHRTVRSQTRARLRKVMLIFLGVWLGYRWVTIKEKSA